MRGMSRLINSDAARELLWKHTSVHQTGEDPVPVGPNFVADDKRQAFMDALEAMGSWPQRPHRIAVANGRGDGIGLVPDPDELQGQPNLVWPDKFLQPSATSTRPTGDNKLAAKLVRALAGGKVNVNTSDIPALDFAPGGTLNSFGIAAHALGEAGFVATAAFPDGVACSSRSPAPWTSRTPATRTSRSIPTRRAGCTRSRWPRRTKATRS